MACHNPGGGSDVVVTIILRAADTADAPAIADVHRRAAQAGLAEIFPTGAAVAPSDALVDDWRRRVGSAAPHGQVGLVADAAGRLAGVIIAGPDETEPRIGQLSRLYVDPRFWGMGIGGHLFRAGLAHLQALGVAEARLWVIDGNRRARDWYERMGWTPTGERKPSCEGAFTCSPGVEDVRYALALARTTGT